MIYEVMGAIVLAFSVYAVLLNNRRNRKCFLIWLVTTSLALVIHAHARIWTLTVRDAIFLLLTFEGWMLWSKEKE